MSAQAYQIRIYALEEWIMNIKKWGAVFVSVFVVALVIAALVTYLWNLLGHGQSAVDWETSIRLAIILGIILAWTKSRGAKEKAEPIVRD